MADFGVAVGSVERLIEEDETVVAIEHEVAGLDVLGSIGVLGQGEVKIGVFFVVIEVVQCELQG